MCVCIYQTDGDFDGLCCVVVTDLFTVYVLETVTVTALVIVVVGVVAGLCCMCMYHCAGCVVVVVDVTVVCAVCMYHSAGQCCCCCC